VRRYNVLTDTECVVMQTSSLSSDMVGIPTADEFMKHKEEFDAKIDSASDELNAGLFVQLVVVISLDC